MLRSCRKTIKRRVLGPDFFHKRGPQNFCGILLARFTHTVWKRVPFADLRVQSLAMKQNAEFTEVCKCPGIFFGVCGPKFMKNQTTYRGSLVLSMPFSLSRFVLKIFAVKVAVKLRFAKSSKTAKICNFRASIIRGGDTPNFAYAFSNPAHFRTRGKCWFSSIQWALRVADEQKADRNNRGKSYKGRRQVRRVI